MEVKQEETRRTEGKRVEGKTIFAMSSSAVPVCRAGSHETVSYTHLLVKGDLGTSLRTKRPVLTEVQGRYMNTVQLTLLSLTWSVIAGVLIGVWSGRNLSLIHILWTWKSQPD